MGYAGNTGPYGRGVVAKEFTFADIGGGALTIGDFPPCLVTSVEIHKDTDFNSGSTDTVDVGFTGVDLTDDADGLVDGFDLSSSTELGPNSVAMKDLAVAKLTENGTFTATFASTGTAATTGECIIIVNYVLLDHITDVSTS